MPIIVARALVALSGIFVPGTWEEHLKKRCSDGGSSAGKYLDRIEQPVAHFSISYNKWNEALEPCAVALPESAWNAEQITTWRSGKKLRIQHAWLKYQPLGCERGTRTLIHILMLITVHFKHHARQLKAVCCVVSN